MSQSPVDTFGPFAHSRIGEPVDTWEPLGAHLVAVAERARRLAEPFGGGDWAFLAGLWHDLGKFRPEFQRRLMGSGEQVEHAGAGAVLAVSRGLPELAFVIAGHHTGLANRETQGDSRQLPLRVRLERNHGLLPELLPRVPPAIRDAPAPKPRSYLPLPGESRDAVACRCEFWIRMVFSALVDADRLETERFYDPGKFGLRAGGDTIPTLRERLDRRLAEFKANSPVNRFRAAVLEDCRRAAAEPPGLFSLAVPTGGGKTLSSLAFALRHAEQHGLRRVIVVVPYTSIIEQNVKVYRGILGDRNVLEHHANLDETERLERLGESEIRRRLAAENWDAPVVVTTNVQFFESLFSNHPSRCRKLHNVVRSVVILDEAQALSTDFLIPVLDAMRALIGEYGCSLVLSTATQPALNRRPALPQGFDEKRVRRIMPTSPELAHVLARVEIRWPRDASVPESYESLAQEIAAEPRALAIVHRRQDARELARVLPSEGTFHLSALMCPVHRSQRLDEIRRCLDSDRICRVVATQLVEAGVDLDFPVVYRALAGLDSLAQAAGRCNREGKLRDRVGRLVPGSFRIFRAPTRPPRGVLLGGLEATLSLLARHGDRLTFTDPAMMEEYFRILYGNSALDARGIQAARAGSNFATVADRFRLIEDEYLHPIIVPWEDAERRVRAFADKPSRETRRALQPYVVQIHEQQLRTLQRAEALESLDDGSVHVLMPHFAAYDPTFGLMVSEDPMVNPEALVGI